MRLRHLVTFTCLAAIGMFMIPLGASAQWACGDCDERFSPWPMKEHKIPASEDASHACGDGVGCYGGYAEGSCSVYQHNHGACGVHFAMQLQELESDPGAVLTALVETEQEFTLVANGSGVIVMGCDGVTPAAFVALSAQVRLIAAAAIGPGTQMGAVVPLDGDALAHASVSEAAPTRSARPSDTFFGGVGV